MCAKCSWNDSLHLRHMPDRPEQAYVRSPQELSHTSPRLSKTDLIAIHCPCACEGGEAHFRQGRGALGNLKTNDALEEWGLVPGPCATETPCCVVSRQRLRGLPLSQCSLGNIARRPNQRCCTRFSAQAWVMAVGVERVSSLTGAQPYLSDFSDTPCHSVFGNNMDVGLGGLNSRQYGLAFVGPSWATRSTAVGSEPTPLRTSGCHHRLQPCRPRRLDNVVGSATRRHCASLSAVGRAADQGSSTAHK